MRTARAWRGVGALVVVIVAAAAAAGGGGPRVADRGCVAGDGGGVVHCQDVLNNSLNGISIHILGH